VKFDDPLPSAPEIEKSVLGLFLANSKRFEEEYQLFTTDMFYDSNHAKIFDFMVQERCIDVLIIHKAIPGCGALLSEMMEYAANIKTKEYAKILSDLRDRRRLMISAQQMYSAAAGGEEEPAKLVHDFISNSSGYGKTSKRIPLPIGEILGQVFGDIDAATRTGIPNGIRTGIDKIDQVLGVCKPGDLIFIAARPGMGKSSLASNILRFNCIQQKIPGLIFTLEMSNEMTAGRILFSEAECSYEAGINGTLKSTEYIKLSMSAGPLSESPIIIDDTPAISLGEVIAKSHTEKINRGIKFIVIDHLQLMNCWQRGMNRNEQLGVVTAGLKSLAKDLEIPIIALSQLSREVDRREDKRPMLSDLRDSGNIEQDADKVLFIYWAYKCEPTDENKDNSEIIIAKNRNGKTGLRRVPWNAETMQFRNIPLQTQSNKGAPEWLNN
jgi:replicative DNA helicase